MIKAPLIYLNILATIFLLLLISFLSYTSQQANSEVRLNGSLNNETSGTLGEDTVQRLAGRYANPEAKMQMEIPKGWNGFRIQDLIDFAIVGPNITDVTDVGNQNVSMTISVFDIPLIKNITSSDMSNDLESTSAEGNEKTCISNSVSLNETTRLECSTQSVNEKSFILATPQKFIIIGFRANSTQVYDANLANFNSSVETLKVDNLTNVIRVMTDLFGSEPL